MNPSRAIAAALLMACAAPAAAESGPEAEMPREFGLFGAETLLLPPAREPAASIPLAPPAPPAVPFPLDRMTGETQPAAPPDADIRRRMRIAAGPDAAAAGAASAWLAGIPPRALLANALWALRGREADVRRAGVAALRILDRPEAVPPLTSRVLYEPDEAVRRDMAAALGALPDPKGEASSYLRRKILTGDRATRIRTAEVMGWTGRRDFIEILVTTYRKISGRSNRAHIFVGTQSRYIDDFDVEVTAGAFALDPHIGTVQYGIALETMVIKIEEEWKEFERRVIRGAIDNLGGLDGKAARPAAPPPPDGAGPN